MISSSNLPYSYRLAPKHRKHFPKPELKSNMMLKDFLIEDSNSCSSTGFKSVSRHQNKNPNFIRNSINDEKLLIRTRSNRWKTMLNAVKNIRFSSGNSVASFLPRSLSRRLSGKKRKNHITSRADEETGKSQVTVTVKIKDILRWRSFRELIEDKYPPLDFDSSPHDHCTTVTTTTGSTFSSNSNSSSKCSSWSDGDFTLAFLPPPWSGENESEAGKKYYLPCVGKETNNEVGPKEKILCAQMDDDSAVSLFDFQTKEAKIRSDEEEAMKLLNHVKESCSISWTFKDKILEQLLLDFFTNELNTNQYDHQTIKLDNYKVNANKMDMIKQAEAWISGVKSSTIVHGAEQKSKDICVKDMEKRGKWRKFEEETQDVGLEIEDDIFGDLLDEILDDLHL